MSNANKIQAWYQIHKWTSLVCTVFLLMLCITGLPLIFYHEIDHLQGKEPVAPEMPENTPQANLDQLVEVGRQQKPGLAMKYFLWYEDEPELALLIMGEAPDSDPEKDEYVVLDNRTGEVLDEPRFREGFMYFLYKLHVDMFAGIPGKLFLGLMGLLFVVSIVSGIMLYGPIMRRFDFGMVRKEKSSRLKWLDLHNLLGVVTLAWALVVGLTGVINTMADIVLGLWQRDQLAEMVDSYKDQPVPAGELSSLEEAVKIARKEAPDMEPSYVAWPGTPFSSEHHYGVFMRGKTPLTARMVQPALIDAQTGALTGMKEMPWYVNTLLLSQPLHFGDYGGLPLKVIWALFDLITIIVLVSGLYLWLARRKARDEQFARLAKAASAQEEAVLQE